jgi:hypothetical protein
MSQLDSIVQLTPSASAPPAGSVFATAVEARFTAAASRSRMDGSTAQMMNQDETMLTAAATPMSSACGSVIACMLAHTLRYDAKCGIANQNVATTSTAATAVRRILRPSRGRVPVTPRPGGSARGARSSVSWMAGPAGDQVGGQQQDASADDRGDPGREVEEALQGVDVEQLGRQPATG